MISDKSLTSLRMVPSAITWEGEDCNVKVNVNVEVILYILSEIFIPLTFLKLLLRLAVSLIYEISALECICVFLRVRFHESILPALPS